MRKNASLFTLSSILASCVIATALGDTPTTDLVCQQWLAKVDADIAALPARPPKDMALLNPTFLSAELYFAAPTETRRQAAVALLTADARENFFAPTAEQAKISALDIASQFALLGDAASARRYLAIADAPSKAPPTTDPIIRLSSNLSGSLRAMAEMFSGNPNAYQSGRLDAFDLLLLAQRLMASNREVEARQVAAFMPTQMAKHAFDHKAGILVQILIMTGDLDKALAVATAAEGSGSGDFTGQPERLRLLIKIARSANLRHRPEIYASAKRAISGLSDFTASEYVDVARLFAFTKDYAAFQTIANALAGEKSPSGGPIGPRDRSELATLALAIGNRATYELQVLSLEKSIRAEPAANSSPSPGESWMLLASAHARDGDTAAVARDLKASRDTKEPASEDAIDLWNAIASVYADAGDFDQAIAAAKHIPDEDSGPTGRYLADQMSAAGQFEGAWAVAAKLPISWRLMAIYNVAISQTAAGQIDAVAKKAAAAETANERVLIELAFVRTLLKKQNSGFLYDMWRSNDY